MMQNASFVRKVIYIACIALLLIPLAMIANPSSYNRNEDDSGGSGGLLARIRTEKELSQSSLGDIDPASESMKLATLGLRPFAVSMLWNKAEEFKKTRNWDRLTATLNQLMKLQPNFVRLWEFQAHTLAFNTSREFDDYEDRYVWVKKGINFLISGIPYNKRDHRMLDNVGYLFGVKIGHADEKWQYRRLLRNDKDFHDELRAEGIDVDAANKRNDGPDNWLLAQQWYYKSEALAESAQGGRRTIGDMIFYMNAPKQSRNFARDTEVEFEPDDFAKRAWEKAKYDWEQFGSREILTTFDTRIQLNSKAENSKKIKKLRDELESLVAPEARESISARKIAMRTDEQKRLMAKPEDKQSDGDKNQIQQLKTKEKVYAHELLEFVDAKDLETAERLVKDIDVLEQHLIVIDKYRSTSNYPYWLERCTAEATDEALEARHALFEANRLMDENRTHMEYKKNPATGEIEIDPETGEKIEIPGAIDEYERSFEAWARVFEKFPAREEASHRLDREIYIQDLEIALTTYSRLVGGSAGWPKDFPLQKLVDEGVTMTGEDLPTTEILMRDHPEWFKDEDNAGDGDKSGEQGTGDEKKPANKNSDSDTDDGKNDDAKKDDVKEGSKEAAAEKAEPKSEEKTGSKKAASDTKAETNDEKSEGGDQAKDADSNDADTEEKQAVSEKEGEAKD